MFLKGVEAFALQTEDTTIFQSTEEISIMKFVNNHKFVHFAKDSSCNFHWLITSFLINPLFLKFVR